MQWAAIGTLGLTGAYLFLNGTGAAEAALILTGAAAFYVAIVGLLFRE